MVQSEYSWTNDVRETIYFPWRDRGQKVRHRMCRANFSGGAERVSHAYARESGIVRIEFC